MISENEVLTSEGRFVEAMRNSDIEALNTLLHDDLLFNGPNGELVTKDMDLAVYKSGNMVLEENIICDQNIKIFGDTAIVSVTIQLKGKFMLQPIEGKFRYIRTWKKINGVIKMIGGGCTTAH